MNEKRQIGTGWPERPIEKYAGSKSKGGHVGLLGLIRSKVCQHPAFDVHAPETSDWFGLAKFKKKLSNFWGMRK